MEEEYKIVSELENKLRDIERNDDIQGNENIELREKIIEFLFNKYKNAEYEKFIKDNKVFVNFWLKNWTESDTSVVFFFEGPVFGLMATPLPHVVQKYNIVCDKEWSFERKKEEFVKYINRANDFVERYCFMIKLKDKIKEKYGQYGHFDNCFDYQNDKRGNFFFIGHINNIGHFHFNLIPDRIIIFAIEKGLSKKIFNIGAERENRTKWKAIKNIEIINFADMHLGFDVIYDLIDKSMENAIKFI